MIIMSKIENVENVDSIGTGKENIPSKSYSQRLLCHYESDAAFSKSRGKNAFGCATFF